MLRDRGARSRTLTLVTVMIAVALGTGVQMARGTGAENALPAPPTPTDRFAAPDRAVDPALRDAFTVLRRAAEAADVPSGIAGRIAGTGDRTLDGADPSNARLVVEGRGTRLYAVPANGALCVIVDQGGDGAGMGCEAAAEVAAHGLATTTARRDGTPGRLVVGIAPDWVRTVDFGSVEAVVRGNGYAATVPEGTYTAILTDGVRAVPIRVPNP